MLLLVHWYRRHKRYLLLPITYLFRTYPKYLYSSRISHWSGQVNIGFHVIILKRKISQSNVILNLFNIHSKSIYDISEIGQVNLLKVIVCSQKKLITFMYRHSSVCSNSINVYPHSHPPLYPIILFSNTFTIHHTFFPALFYNDPGCLESAQR